MAVPARHAGPGRATVMRLALLALALVGCAELPTVAPALLAGAVAAAPVRPLTLTTPAAAAVAPAQAPPPSISVTCSPVLYLPAAAPTETFYQVIP